MASNFPTYDTKVGVTQDGRTIFIKNGGTLVIEDGGTIQGLDASSTGGSIYNLKTDFGAVGDGITDDTSPTNDAYSTIALAGGGSLFVPSGIYNVGITAPLVPGNKIMQFGAGPSSIFKFADGLEKSTSTTSNAVGSATGTRTWTTQTGKTFKAGQNYIAVSRASIGTGADVYIRGIIQTYNADGTFIGSATSVQGSGTLTDWDLRQETAISGGQALIYSDTLTDFSCTNMCFDGNRDDHGGSYPKTSGYILALNRQIFGIGGTSARVNIYRNWFYRASNSAVYFRGGTELYAYRNYAEDGLATDFRAGFVSTHGCFDKNSIVRTGNYDQSDDGMIAVRWDGMNHWSVQGNQLRAPAGSGLANGIWITNGNNLILDANDIDIPDAPGIYLNYGQGLPRVTSTTSNDIASSGNLTFAVSTDTAYAVNDEVTIIVTGDETKWMRGRVLTYTYPTAVITISEGHGVGTAITTWTLDRSLSLTNHKITNNILNTGGAIAVVDARRGCNISGLDMTGNTCNTGLSAAITCQPTYTQTAFSKVNCSDNIITLTPNASGDKGILIDSDGAIICRNNIDSNGTVGADGIDTYGDFCAINGNVIDLHSIGSGAHGIFLRGIRNIVNGNVLKNAVTNAIREDVAADFNIITGNQEYNSGATLIVGTSTQYIPGNVKVRTTGRETKIFWPGDFYAPASVAAATLVSTATSNGAGKVDTPPYWSFDPTTEQYVYFNWVPPKAWDKGTITFQLDWSHTTGGTVFLMVFRLAGYAVTDLDALSGLSFATTKTVNDTGGTAGTRYVTAESSGLTVDGSAIAGDMISFRLSRFVASASDTMDINAFIHCMRMYYTTNASNDT